MTKLRDFEKVMKVINSCKTVDHLQAAEKMIDLYKKRYNYDSYHKDLDIYFHKKLRFII